MCFINIRTCHSHGHCWDYRPGCLSLKSSYCNSFEITWTKIDLSLMRFCDNHLRAFSHQTPWPWITEMSLKITYLNFESNLPGAIELSEIWWKWISHYSDVIMSAMASQITSISIVSPTVCSGADQRKYQSSASLAFVNGIHRYPVDSPHKGPVMQKIFPFDDIVMVVCFPYSAFVPLSTRRNRSSYWWT